MQITAESLFMPFIGNGVNIYTAKDEKYTASARNATINRLGPSESLNKANSILEQMTAVAANIINEPFLI